MNLLFAPGEIVPEMPQKRRRTKYDWDSLADGQARRLERGVHFRSTVEGMRSTLVAHAKRADIAVLIVIPPLFNEARDSPDLHIFVQFFPERRFAQGSPEV